MATGRTTSRPFRSRRPAAIAAVVLTIACGHPAAAAPRIVVPETLKRSALACLAEALKLCPNALAAKDHGVSCIVGKRRLLSRPCQGIYDQALSLLHGQDLHFDLRPPKRTATSPKP